MCSGNGSCTVEVAAKDETGAVLGTKRYTLGVWEQLQKAFASEFPADDLAELEALDAVALSAEGVSAYPFSARDTGISVRLHGRRVGVMCAIDALAIPPAS